MSEQPKWGMTDYGGVTHLTGERVAEYLTLRYYALCQEPTAHANPYLLSTFPTRRGIRTMRSWGYVCKRCQHLFEQGEDVIQQAVGGKP
jgi:hypothetical protein